MRLKKKQLFTLLLEFLCSNQEHLQISKFELKILSTTQLFFSFVFVETLSGQINFHKKQEDLFQQNMLLINAQSFQVNNNQFIIWIILKSLFLALLIKCFFYHKNQSELSNNFQKNKLLQFLNKFLLCGGYWSVILIKSSQNILQKRYLGIDILWILNLAIDFVIVLYSFLINYLGIPEFNSNLEKSHPTKFLLYFQIKSILPIYIYRHMNNYMSQFFALVLSQVLLQLLITKQLKKMPFIKYQTNKMFFFLTFIQTYYQLITPLFAVFFSNHPIQNARILTIITIPFFVKLIDFYFNNSLKSNKRGMFDFTYEQKDDQTLKKIKNKYIFKIIQFIKHHYSICRDPFCLCQNIKSENFDQSDLKIYDPKIFKTPCFQNQLVLRLLLQDISKSKKFEDQYFYISKVITFLYQPAKFFSYTRQNLFDHREWHKLFFQTKLQKIFQQTVKLKEKQNCQNLLKHIDINKIFEQKNVLRILKLQIKRYLQILIDLLNETQNLEIDLNKIKNLNEKLYKTYNIYYKKFTQIPIDQSLKKIHKDFFINFVFVEQEKINVSQKQTQTEYNNLFRKQDLFYDVTQHKVYNYLIVDFSPWQLGTIKNTNVDIENFLGIQRKKLVKQSINILLDQKFQDHHDIYLQNYIQTGIKEFSTHSHNIFVRHQQGYSIQVHVQQKFFYCNRNNTLLDFVLLKPFIQQDKIIITDFQGYITDFSKSILDVFSSFQRVRNTFNICQLLPKSLDWLSWIYQHQQKIMSIQQNKEGIFQKYFFDFLKIPNNSKISKQKLQKFHNILTSFLGQNDKQNLHEQIKRIQNINKEFFYYFEQKKQIIYSIYIIKIKDYDRVIIKIEDLLDINYRNGLFKKGIFDLFFKMTLMKIFLGRFCKKLKAKKSHLFQIADMQKLNEKTEIKNSVRYSTINQKQNKFQKSDFQIQSQNRQRKITTILQNILENKITFFYSSILILLLALFFITPAAFMSYSYKNNSILIKNSLLVLARDQWEYEIMSKLKVYFFLKENYPKYYIILHTVKQRLQNLIVKYYKTQKFRKDQEHQQNNQSKNRYKCFEFVINKYYNVQKSETQQANQIYDDVNQIVETCLSTMTDSTEQIKTQIFKQAKIVFVCMTIQLIIIIAIAIVNKFINQFFNKVYKFCQLIGSQQKKIKQIQNFLIQHNLNKNLFLQKQSQIKKHGIKKLKKVQTNYRFVFQLLAICLIFNLIYLIFSINLYKNLYLELQNVKTLRSNQNSSILLLFDILKDQNLGVERNDFKMIKEYESAELNFYRYMNINQEYYKSVVADWPYILYSYQYQQTLLDMHMIIKSSRYSYALLQIFIDKIIQHSQRAPVSRDRFLHEFTYIMMCQELFNDNIAIIISPMQQYQERHIMIFMIVVIFIFIFLFLCFYRLVLTKKKMELKISLYIFKFLDSKKFYSNSSLKLFVSNLSSIKQLNKFN